MNRRGFTLIELMICVAILGAIIEIVPLLGRAFQHLRRTAQAQSEIACSAETLALVLGRDARSANAVGGRFREFVASETTLILDLPKVGPGGRLRPGGGDRIVYRLDPKDPSRLLKEVFPASGSRRAAGRQVLASNLLSLKFSGTEGSRLVSWEADFGASVEKRGVHRRFLSAAALRRAGF